jgi:hypothetical protein
MNVTSHIRKYLPYISIVFLSVVLVSFIFRDLLVSTILTRKIDRFNQTNHAGLKVKKIRVQWLASFMMTGITMKPDQADSLLKIDTAFISINGWKLLAGRVVFDDLILKNITCSFIRKGNETNYDFLFKKREQQVDSTPEPVNYAYAVDRLTGFVFDMIPKWIRIRNLKLSINTNGHLLLFQLDRFSIEDHKFRVPILITENFNTQLWILKGMIDRNIRSATISLYPLEKQKAFLPFLSYKWNAGVGFDTVFFSLSEKKKSDSLTNITGTASITGFNFDHASISKKMVSVEKLAISYSINIGPDYAELDSITTVIFNKLDLHPYIRYRTKPTKQVTLRLNKSPFPAQELFSSLPQGLFTNLEAIQVKGDLSYYFDFFVDLSLPDSLHFTSELRRHQFSVVSYGNNDLTRLNTPFSYTAYEKGEPVRTFTVGSENPNFRPIERISPFLQAAVLTSEDPSFYQHRGFLQDAFRESIITDIKEHKFARGGSTISMQLVKNVFLNRNKTIARKFEEALLVWLIENQGLCTKQRMFEVYLNIIEWGPLVYGANEAARFYFNKDAAKLTLAESIFLASIIPRPKWFRYNFNETGHLRDSQAGFFSLLSEKMLNRGLISQHDFDNLNPDVELKGPAKLLLKKADAIPADSLSSPDN